LVDATPPLEKADAQIDWESTANTKQQIDIMVVTKPTFEIKSFRTLSHLAVTKSVT
jgi:hypothetical protein